METKKSIIETIPENLGCFGAQRKKNKREKNDRRFSDEQIKLLEAIFESETRIEARKKEEVAKELGLQPRQVAIWFQNKRARWKSKQIEQDYRALTADFAELARRFETLKKEKQTLLIQLQKLNELLDKECKNKYIQESKAELRLDNGPSKSQNESKTCSSHQGTDHNGVKSSLDENAEHSWIDVGERHETLLEMIGTEDASSASMGRWDSLNSEDLFNDQSCSISHWLDFWN